MFLLECFRQASFQTYLRFLSLSFSEFCPNVETITSSWTSASSTLNSSENRFKTKTSLVNPSYHLPTFSGKPNNVKQRRGSWTESGASSLMETDPYLGEIRHWVSSSAGGSRSGRSCEVDTLTDR